MRIFFASLLAFIAVGCSSQRGAGPEPPGHQLQIKMIRSDPESLVVLSPGKVLLEVTSETGPIKQLTVEQPSNWSAKVEKGGTRAVVTVSGIVPPGASQTGFDLVLVKSKSEVGSVHLSAARFVGKEFSKFLNPQVVQGSIGMDPDDDVTRQVLSRLKASADRNFVTLTVSIVDPGPNPIGTGWNQNFLWHWGADDKFICHNLNSPISFGTEAKGEAMLAAWQAGELQMDPRGNYSPRRCDTAPPTGKRAIVLKLIVD